MADIIVEIPAEVSDFIINFGNRTTAKEKAVVQQKLLLIKKRAWISRPSPFLARFERAAFRLGGERSILLSYRNLLLGEVDMALEPDDSLEPPAHLGLPNQVYYIDCHVKCQFITANC